MAEMQETNNIDISSSRNKDDIYDKFTDEDFKSEKNIKELIEFVEEYDNFLSLMIQYLCEIYYRVYISEFDIYEDDILFVVRGMNCSYDTYYKNMQSEEPAKFKCILRFIDFVIKNKNDFKDEYKIIDNLITYLYTIKYFRKEIKEHRWNDKNDITAKIWISSSCIDLSDNILSNHNMILD